MHRYAADTWVVYLVCAAVSAVVMLVDTEVRADEDPHRTSLVVSAILFVVLAVIGLYASICETYRRNRLREILRMAEADVERLTSAEFSELGRLYAHDVDRVAAIERLKRGIS